ncbi:MAG: hypothetical protein JSS82_07035 [Bacteroidetes bacterium]|nr:hypothetical protein [Bacteroidota bacterium]
MSIQNRGVELSPATQPDQSGKQETTGILSSLSSADEQEITGNNSNQSYDLKTNNLGDEAAEKKEITFEPQIGNNQDSEKITPPQETGSNPLGSLPARSAGGREASPAFEGSATRPVRPVGGQSHDNRNKTVEVGYLGQKQDIDPNGIKTIEYKPDDSIQKFSIGEAVYYIKKKE